MGRMKALAIGRIKVSFGQGLVINNSLGFGKLAMLSMLGRQATAIRAHSSRSAANYLQGAASAIEIAKHLNLTTFLSYRSIDATLTDGGTIKTILKTMDYHRTLREISRKDAASQLAAGAHVGWSSGALSLGLSGVYSRFNKDLTPNTSLYYRITHP